MKHWVSRRQWLRGAVQGASAVVVLASGARARAAPTSDERVARATFDFIDRCRRPDGRYAPSPDPAYAGNSDTRLSDLAAVTYAAVLAKTMGRPLAHAEQSVAFLQGRQRPDGRFVNAEGELDPGSDHAVLYNTTQGVVALRALGQCPEFDPTPVIAGFFEGDRFKKLPWFTTSFYPLVYAALGKPLPDQFRKALETHMFRNQADDGYLGDHVAATFHMAHFDRLVGRPTPGADRMVRRVLRDQKADGGWNIKEPDWDVHACFDAVFILRQLGGDDPKVRAAIDRGAEWSLRCQNADGGFGHYPGRHSDMDAVYFQFANLIQAGRIPGARDDLPDAQTLGWGHAMRPGKDYSPRRAG
jgi:geranylgeranyl transferase type-2 subunit beta